MKLPGSWVLAARTLVVRAALEGINKKLQPVETVQSSLRLRAQGRQNQWITTRSRRWGGAVSPVPAFDRYASNP